MDKNLIFFFISCCTVNFSIIVIYLDSYISNLLNTNLRNKQCQLFKNLDEANYYDEKSASSKEMKTKIKTYLKKGKKLCSSNKTMNKFKYVSFYINILFGILCAILSLLHHYNIARRFERYTGLIGVISGIVGIILTSIFIVYNGLLYSNKDFGKDLIYNNLDNPAQNKKKEVVSYKNNKNEWDTSEKQYYNFYYGENDEELTYKQYKELCQAYKNNKNLPHNDNENENDNNEKRFIKSDFFLGDNYEQI